MNKIIVADLELTVDNATEILRMGGPYIGDISLGSDFISKDCVLENFIYKDDSNLLFFVKANPINNYYYFTINFYNLKTKTLFEFDKEFEMLYLKEFISNNELHIYNSFNDQLGNNYYFKLEEEDFHAVPNN